MDEKLITKEEMEQVSGGKEERVIAGPLADDLAERVIAENPTERVIADSAVNGPVVTACRSKNKYVRNVTESVGAECMGPRRVH